MGQVIFIMHMSLDGFIEGINGDLSWSNPDEELFQHFIDLERTFDVHLYGRRLYENMAAYWSTADEKPAAPQREIEYARIWKSIPNIVFSKTLDHVGRNSRLVKGNIADEVNKLKEQPGRVMNVGGAELAATFTRLGLIDEYRFYVHPVVLGSGKPLFGPLYDKLHLQLVDTYTFGSGIVILRYRRADERQ